MAIIVSGIPGLRIGPEPVPALARMGIRRIDHEVYVMTFVAGFICGVVAMLIVLNWIVGAINRGGTDG